MDGKESELELGGMEGGSAAAPTAAEARFHAVVGHLEDVVLGGRTFTADGPSLLDELEAWNRAHCAVFLPAPSAAAQSEGSSGSSGAGGDVSSGGGGGGGSGSGGSGSGGSGSGGGSGGGGLQGTEHSPVWYELFKQYTALVEERLEAALLHLDPPCSGEELQGLLTAHADELSGDLFDLLMSLDNYEEFVQTMVAYAEQMAHEGKGASGSGGGGGEGVSLAPTVTRLGR
jgi:hypothetical protein